MIKRKHLCRCKHSIQEHHLTCGHTDLEKGILCTRNFCGLQCLTCHNKEPQCFNCGTNMYPCIKFKEMSNLEYLEWKYNESK